MTQKPETMRRKVLWAYCRVSTSHAEQELSLEQQVAWAKAFAQQRASRLEIFAERASAKTIVRRPQCVKMLSRLAECKPADRPSAVIATSFDRLSRDITDTMILARALRDAGVELYVRDRGKVEMTSFADQAALVGQAMGGHAENEARSNRAKASWDRRRREGKPTSNKTPYGIQLRNEMDSAVEESAVWVLRAFEWYAAGVGMSTIAKRLQAGAPPHRVKTSKVSPDGEIIIRERQPVWESNRVRKLFEQRRYRGLIVPEALFDEVVERLNNRPRLSQRRINEYPLSGAIRCATCDRVFHGHATRTSKKIVRGEIHYYPDAKRIRAYVCTVCRYQINADRLETWFRDDIGNLAAHPKTLRKFVANPHGRSSSPSGLRSEAARLAKAIANVDRKRQRAWDFALNAAPEVENDLPDQLRRLNLEESELRDQLAAIEAALESDQRIERTIEFAKKMLSEFWQSYEKATYEQKRELCNELVRALGGASATKLGLVWSGTALHAI
ncbi:MAG: recombinase family protein [Candidatus Aquilonibacter sp.]